MAGMKIEDLWSPAREQALERMLASVEAGDVCAAVRCIGVGEQRQVDEAEQWLAELGAGLKGVRADHPLEAAQALARALHDDAGLCLDVEDDGAAAGDVHRALHSGAGDLIALGTIWCDVARRAGWGAELLEMDAFVAISLDGVLIDVTSGAVVTAADCRRIVTEVSDDEVYFEAAFLEPAPAARVADRALRRRVASAKAAADTVRIYRELRLLAALHDDDDALQLELGEAAEQAGHRSFARALYLVLRGRAPDGPTHNEATRRLKLMGGDTNEQVH